MYSWLQVLSPLLNPSIESAFEADDDSTDSACHTLAEVLSTAGLVWWLVIRPRRHHGHLSPTASIMRRLVIRAVETNVLSILFQVFIIVLYSQAASYGSWVSTRRVPRSCLTASQALTRVVRCLRRRPAVQSERQLNLLRLHLLRLDRAPLAHESRLELRPSLQRAHLQHQGRPERNRRPQPG